MNQHGKVSVLGFLLGLIGCLSTPLMEVSGLLEFGQNEIQPIYECLLMVTMYGFFILLFVLILVKANSSIAVRKKTHDRQEYVGVIARSSFLGWIFSIGIVLIQYNGLWESPFGLYMCILSFFHWSEYVTTSLTSPSTLSTDSFLLNHSKAYGLAAVASWAEFGLESYFFPGVKRVPVVILAGLMICLMGEMLRKLAMLTAMENFTHIIRSEKVEGHKLITHGVFRLCRHPSYAGWFWWSVGTQVLLVNPICIIGYAMASWNFFCYRITYEEATLLSFFREDYIQYQDRVPWTGVPLVTGYKSKDKKKSL